MINVQIPVWLYNFLIIACVWSVVTTRKNRPNDKGKVVQNYEGVKTIKGCSQPKIIQKIENEP